MSSRCGIKKPSIPTKIAGSCVRGCLRGGTSWIDYPRRGDRSAVGTRLATVVNFEPMPRPELVISSFIGDPDHLARK